MTTQQTSVSDQAALPFAGKLNESVPSQVATRVSEESSAETPFGVMVIRGTDKDNQALLCHTSSAVCAPLLAGVVLHSHAYAKDTQLGNTGVKPNQTLNILEKGQVYVLPEEAVAPGDAVRIRAVAAGGEVKGAFRKTADDTSDCVLLAPSMARWITSGGPATPCLVEIDMTAEAATADS